MENSLNKRYPVGHITVIIMCCGLSWVLLFMEPTMSSYELVMENQLERGLGLRGKLVVPFKGLCRGHMGACRGI